MPQSAAVATGTASEATLSSDGRVRRRERNGKAIVDAMFALVGEGLLEPTAQQVAARAGVGIRTVFRRFSDMESLFAEMGARMQAEALPLLGVARRDGDPTARARDLVARRVAFFERIAPYKRAANLRRWRSPFLGRGHVRLVTGLRTDLVQSLPELGQAPADVVDALELATSFEAWDRLRSEQRLGPERAQATVERVVLSLVAALNPPTGRSRR
jgi:AcrR family transcriptional regulator